MKKLVLITLTALLASACTRHPHADNEEVSAAVAKRIDSQVKWYKGCPNEQIKCWVQSLLENELTPESAIQIALLKNPKVQSVFEELGIAHADLIEAGLLTNPDFSCEIRYPRQKALHTNIEYLVTSTFLDIFLVPLRKRIAEAEVEQAKRRVTNEILNLAFDVRQTYYELIAAEQKLKLTRPIVELTSIQSEIVLRQQALGNVSVLDLQLAQSKLLEAKLEITKVQDASIRLRAKLNQLLGLKEEICLFLPELPQEIDYEGDDICALESVALSERMDLQEASFEIIRLSRMLGLKEGWAYTNLKAGIAGERDPDGLNLVGFGVSGEIPIFNYGQAARLRLSAQLRQAQDRYEFLKIQILSEVREAHKLLKNDLEIIKNYKTKIIPLQNEISNSSEAFYGVMGLGVDRLLDNKRRQLEAYRNYLEILKSYWIARVQLDKALGGYLFRLLPKEYCGEDRI